MATRRYITRYGSVFHSSTCKDNHANIKVVNIGDETYRLQASAGRSLRAVARALGGPWNIRPVDITGSWRSCAYQHELWLSDKGRYAHPDSTLHTQGLAIDVHTGHLTEKLRKSLLAHGWHQSRPVDEPWHFSFRLTA